MKSKSHNSKGKIDKTNQEEILKYEKAREDELIKLLVDIIVTSVLKEFRGEDVNDSNTGNNI